MSTTIKQIGSSIDAKLAALKARAEAFHAQFTLTRHQAAARMKHQKQAARDALDRLDATVQRQPGVAAAKKQKIAAAVGELKVQIALGKAEAGDALEAQRKKIGDSVDHFEKLLDRELARVHEKFSARSDAVMRRYVRARDALIAELEAVTARIREETVHRGANLVRRKRELAEKVLRARQQLVEKRKRSSESRTQSQHALKKTADQFGKALKTLFS